MQGNQKAEGPTRSPRPRTEKGKSAVFLLSLRAERCFCWLSLLGRVLCFAVVFGGRVLFFAVVALAQFYLAVVPGALFLAVVPATGFILLSLRRHVLFVAVRGSVTHCMASWVHPKPKATTANQARVPTEKA